MRLRFALLGALLAPTLASAQNLPRPRAISEQSLTVVSDTFKITFRSGRRGQATHLEWNVRATAYTLTGWTGLPVVAQVVAADTLQVIAWQTGWDSVRIRATAHGRLGSVRSRDSVIRDFTIAGGTGPIPAPPPPPPAPPPPPPPPPAPVLTFTATPGTITVGQSSTLTWSATNAGSCTASGSWTGERGISGSLIVTPSASSSYTLTCTGTGGSDVETRTVTVTYPAPIVTLQALPLEIVAGDSTTLTWTSENASGCTASGGWSGAKPLNGSERRAPSSTASFTLTCSGLGGTNGKTVTITVTPTPTPVPPPPVGCSNRPADHLAIADYDFSNLSPTSGVWRFNSTTNMTVTPYADATAPQSPNGTMAFAWPVGTTTGPMPGWDIGLGPRRELYLCWFMKVESPFDFHSSGVQKLWFFGTNQNDVVGNEVFLSLWGQLSTAQILGVVQEPFQGTAADGPNGHFSANISQPGFTLGQWYKLEVHVVRNTNGQRNGILKWWVNGQLVGSHSNVMYNNRTGENAHFNRFFFQHYWGGQGDTKTQADTIWTDHITLTGLPDSSGQPLPLPPPPPPPEPSDTNWLFLDTFTGGVRAAAQNGISWSGTNTGTGDAVAVVPDAGNSSGFALAFTFGADVSYASDAFAEQNMRLNPTVGFDEIFVCTEYAVPADYFHRDDPNGPDNNKGIRIFGGLTTASTRDQAYQDYGAKVGFSTLAYPLTHANSGKSQIITEFSSGTTVGNFSTGPWRLWWPAGTVQKIGYYAKVGTFPGTTSPTLTGDGIIRIWQNGTLVYDKTNLPIYKTGYLNRWQYLYLLGWSNSGFNATTTFLLRRIRISKQPFNSCITP